MLYTCPVLAVALREARIAAGKPAYVIKYKCAEELRLAQVGFRPSATASDRLSDERLSDRIFHAFLASEFTRPAGDLSDPTYWLSAALANEIFSFDHDGIKYPSVQYNPDVCIAIRAEAAREKLLIERVFRGRAVSREQAATSIPKSPGSDFAVSRGRHFFESTHEASMTDSSSLSWRRQQRISIQF